MGDAVGAARLKGRRFTRLFCMRPYCVGASLRAVTAWVWASAPLIPPLLTLPLLAPTLPKAEAAEAGETRCGWFINPTPGNFWLADPDGEWDIAWQGQPQPPGFERLPDMSAAGWVETNGYYGYGCGCVTGVLDKRAKRFVSISAAKPQPLKICRTDPRLPAFGE